MNKISEFFSKLFSNLVFLLITPFLAILLIFLFVFPGYKNYILKKFRDFLDK